MWAFSTRYGDEGVEGSLDTPHLQVHTGIPNGAWGGLHNGDLEGSQEAEKGESPHISSILLILCESYLPDLEAGVDREG